MIMVSYESREEISLPEFQEYLQRKLEEGIYPLLAPFHMFEILI